MTSTRNEMGLVEGDVHAHIAVLKLNGAMAMCGAGKIVQRVPGWFDPADPSSCATCVQRLSDNG